MFHESYVLGLNYISSVVLGKISICVYVCLSGCIYYFLSKVQFVSVQIFNVVANFFFSLLLERQSVKAQLRDIHVFSFKPVLRNVATCKAKIEHVSNES